MTLHDSLQPTSGGGMALRLFAALPVPMEVAARLADAAEALASGSVGLRAIDPADLHVTLAFLGDVTEEHVPVVAAALDAAAAEVHGAVECTVTHAAPFGGNTVLGLEVELDLLATVAAARDRFVRAIVPYAPAADHRSWRPHISLVRGRDSDAAAARRLDAVLPGDVGWVAREVQLIASLPGPAGRHHRSLHAATLGEPVSPRG